MGKEDSRKGIILLSISLLFLSVGFQTKELGEKEEIDIEIQSIDVRNMAKAQNTIIEEIEEAPFLDSLTNSIVGSFISSTEEKEAKKIVEVKMPKVKNSKTIQKVEELKPLEWYLPTEVGVVTQRPSYYHMALDITSPRGTRERIHPVAKGVISGIYTDSYGALIVTVLHDNNGKKYTSQYVHLSRYEYGLHVGQEVNPSDTLGYMGSTGYSTGVHLHLTVLECSLFDPNDRNCSDLNGFFRFSRTSYQAGLRGLESYRNVPYSWNNR